MAIEVDWDQVAGQQLDETLRQGTRLVRSGFVRGITLATAGSAKLALHAVKTAIAPAIGSSFDAAHPTLICVHNSIQGVPNTGGTMARIFSHYETPGGGGTPLERFAAEDVTNLVAEPTGVFPGTAQQLRCSLTENIPTYDDPEGPEDRNRPIIANYPRVMRALILYGLFSDRPSWTVLNCANKVNHDEWQGLGRARWRCEGARVRYSSLDGMYAVSVGFLTKGDAPGNDWATYEIPRKSDGQLATVTSEVLDVLYAQTYENEVLYDSDGVFKAGFYGVANFSAIFGDSFPIGD